MIDLTPMANAVGTLTESLGLIDEYGKGLPERLQLLVQRGLIQTFEYNYELAIVTMTRYLKETASDPDKHDLAVFEELIRVADEHRLILSPFARWKAFRHARNMTSHTYVEAKALAVVQLVPEFEKEVAYLLARLQEKSK